MSIHFDPSKPPAPPLNLKRLQRPDTSSDSTKAPDPFAAPLGINLNPDLSLLQYIHQYCVSLLKNPSFPQTVDVPRTHTDPSIQSVFSAFHEGEKQPQKLAELEKLTAQVANRLFGINFSQCPTLPRRDQAPDSSGTPPSAPPLVRRGPPEEQPPHKT